MQRPSLSTLNPRPSRRALEACKALNLEPPGAGTTANNHSSSTSIHSNSNTNGSSQWSLVDLWLKCLPLPGEVQGFFLSLPHVVGARLRAARCIPTEGGE